MQSTLTDKSRPGTTPTASPIQFQLQGNGGQYDGQGAAEVGGPDGEYECNLRFFSNAEYTSTFLLHPDGTWTDLYNYYTAHAHHIEGATPHVSLQGPNSPIITDPLVCQIVPGSDGVSEMLSCTDVAEGLDTFYAPCNDGGSYTDELHIGPPSNGVCTPIDLKLIRVTS